MQTTPVRDMYINVLEKRAAEAAAAGPDYSIDSQEVATGEVDANQKDQRQQLGGLFETTKATEKATTKQMGQVLPMAKKTEGTQASNSLLKVAQHEAFFVGLRQTDLLKTAELEYIRTAFNGFEDELTKMARLGMDIFKGVKSVGREGAESIAGQIRHIPKPPARMPAGSVVQKMPAAGPRHMSSEALQSALDAVPKRDPSAITAAQAARFNKAPVRVGGGSGAGVWKLAQEQQKLAFMQALKKIIPKKTPKAWGPGKVLKGSNVTKPGTVNWGAFAAK